MDYVQQFFNALVQGCIYALIALGYTMVYGVLRLINFAHGDVYMLGAFFGLFAFNGLASVTNLDSHAATPLWFTPLVFLAAMILSALVGMLMERLAYRPLRGAPRLTALITAIGVSLLLEYGGQMAFTPDPQSYPTLLPNIQLFKSSGLSLTLTQVVIVIAAFAMMAALHLFINYTKTGRAMRAVSLDRAAASLMGINTNTIISFTFALGGALAAAAGVLQAMNQPQVDPLMGIQVGLRAFVAAVLGGIGSIPGAVLGGLLMAFAEVATVQFHLSQYRDAVSFAILIIVLVVRPAGLLGRNTVEKV